MKKIARSAWNEFFYGGQVLSLGPVFIVFCALTLLNAESSIWLYVIVYLLTYPIYSFDRYLDFKNESLLHRKEYLEKKLGIIPYLIVADIVVLFVILALTGNIQSILFVVFLLLIGFLYPVYFKKFTKKLKGFKSFYVTLAYTSVIFLAAIYSNLQINTPLIMLFLFFALRCFGNAIYCDIKDKESDALLGLKTFAVLFSDKEILIILFSINFISLLPLFYLITSNNIPFYSILLVLSFLYSSFYILKTFFNDKNSELGYILADLELVLWPALILIGRGIWTILG